MLETEEQSEQDWHAVIETEEGCCSSLFSHKREIRPEEESVVVFSNESIFGGKRLYRTSCFLSKAVFRRMVGADTVCHDPD